jgi:hypothetical protein
MKQKQLRFIAYLLAVAFVIAALAAYASLVLFPDAVMGWDRRGTV